MSTDPRFAEPTPFARLVYAHAVSVAGDACLTVSLAGSLFFQSPTTAARGKVLLYLLITMAPFAIVAPILGPAIDRTRGGRRLLVVGSSGGRAVLCLFMAIYVSKPAPEGLLVYPLAFGALVLAKGHQIAKSALVPALVKSDDELVNANSRLALLSVIAATVGGVPAAGIQQLFGADWSLRVAAVVFAIAAVLAWQIPKTRVRAPEDNRQAELENAEIHQPSILLAGSAMAVLRGSVGFLAFFVAFALKDDLFGLGMALAASAAGGFVGVVAAPVVRRSVREEVILASSLVLPAACALLGTLFGGSTGFVVAAFALAVGAGAGRLGFDSLLQRDGPDAVRGRAFARFETRFQVTWVIGGMLGLIPIAESVGLFLLAGVLAFAAVSYVGALRAASKRGMRSKLLPGSVDRAITRSRSQAMGKVRGRFRKPARTPGNPPDGLQPDGLPPDELSPNDLPPKELPAAPEEG
jgi:Na+/melibiose symporter-like transporter